MVYSTAVKISKSIKCPPKHNTVTICLLNNGASTVWLQDLTRQSTRWIRFVSRLTRIFSTIFLGSNLDVSWHIVGIVDDDAWLIEAYKWAVCSTVPYSTVLIELWAQKHLYQDLHCIGLLAETRRFFFTMWDSPRSSFSFMRSGRSLPLRLLLISPSFTYFS